MGIALAACLVLTLMPIARADDKPLEVVPSVDLQRYAGTWYEIARLPNRFQKDCVGDVSATYRLLEDGRLEVVNACREADGSMKKAAGVARLANKSGPTSKLEVRFAPGWLSWIGAVWGDYWVIDLAPDYSASLVGSPDRKYLWVLARTPRIDDAVYDGLLEKAKSQGFDVSRMQKTAQSQGG
jgi:apolipoprotein D and lipocalin family protein